jgi:hypothetical protein
MIYLLPGSLGNPGMLLVIPDGHFQAFSFPFRDEEYAIIFPFLDLSSRTTKSTAAVIGGSAKLETYPNNDDPGLCCLLRSCQQPHPASFLDRYGEYPVDKNRLFGNLCYKAPILGIHHRNS